ncbi:hypothetical protein EVAR_33128_1 [Eumeta japonica]|uniref:Uncharacterized protein n=1 Tax=Eumeta variegata TaxID=151549 RepID=A0A4C1YB72_EUMVA|nr:hypothetical protein EVAR_33128_1 [Eumeta japonica]
MEMRSLGSMCRQPLKDICRNSDIRERLGLMKDVVSRVERCKPVRDIKTKKESIPRPSASIRRTSASLGPFNYTILFYLKPLGLKPPTLAQRGLGTGNDLCRQYGDIVRDRRLNVLSQVHSE